MKGRLSQIRSSLALCAERPRPAQKTYSNPSDDWHVHSPCAARETSSPLTDNRADNISCTGWNIKNTLIATYNIYAYVLCNMSWHIAVISHTHTQTAHTHNSDAHSHRHTHTHGFLLPNPDRACVFMLKAPLKKHPCFRKHFWPVQTHIHTVQEDNNSNTTACSVKALKHTLRSV